MSYRIAFMGTPEFSVPSLEALVAAGYKVVGVFTQPDRPAGRGNKLVASPVKQCALKHGLPVFQFERVSRAEGLEAMRSIEPDVIVTAAFGQILKQALLDIPKYGTVNVHASLLPKYRGSAPINWCILCGEKVAGVTTMLTDAGIDTGDMLLSRSLEIGENETAGELSPRLAELGGELLIETLEGYLSGKITPVKQNPEEASYQPMLDKSMGAVDWSKSAQEICNLARGLHPWPCAYTQLDGLTLKLHRTRVSDCGLTGEPGQVLVSDNRRGVIVACGSGTLEIEELQAPGGKRMDAKVYVTGHPIPVGSLLKK